MPPNKQTQSVMKAIVAGAVTDIEGGSHNEIVGRMTNHVSEADAERMLKELHDEINDVASYLDGGEIDEARRVALSAAYKFTPL